MMITRYHDRNADFNRVADRLEDGSEHFRTRQPTRRRRGIYYNIKRSYSITARAGILLHPCAEIIDDYRFELSTFAL